MKLILKDFTFQNKNTFIEVIDNTSHICASHICASHICAIINKESIQSLVYFLFENKMIHKDTDTPPNTIDVDGYIYYDYPNTIEVYGSEGLAFWIHKNDVKGMIQLIKFLNQSK